MKVVIFVTEEGSRIPSIVATSERQAVSLTVGKMLDDKVISIEDMANVKSQLNENKRTEGYKTNYYFTEIQTNKIL